MKAVIQRVKSATLVVEGEEISHIDFGLVVFLGIGIGDSMEQAKAVAKKVAQMRIFKDNMGKKNLSVKDVGGQVLLVSNFTLYGDASRGNRPSFSHAECGEIAKPIYEYCALCIQENGVPVKTGVFGADMQITQLNDGPVTIIYEI